ncbi:MAG: response regulator [bacterium]|nr:response regulator [bacterium]
MSDIPPKKQRVLLIDDDQFLLNMYSLKFTNSGFEVETATSAVSALQKLRDGLVPDVLLCDLVMPTMDGLEFIKQVKEERLAPSSAFVVLTNQGQQGEIERAKELGVDGYIVKASTIPSEVVEEVKTILAKKLK